MTSFATFSPREIKLFQIKILSWYYQNKRSLPWREIPFDNDLRQRDPYKILISEVMSQQTQIDRVIPKYESWLNRFPTIADLAKASVAEVLQFWSGLGYNRRALNLKKTAEIITSQYTGKFPQEESTLLTLPGIGAYTARAILCFAFNQQVAVVDTNVRKVILTQFLYRHPDRSDSEVEGSSANQSTWVVKDSSTSLRYAQNDKKFDNKEIEVFAAQLVPHGKAYEWNQALMDYASVMLKKEKVSIPKQSIFKGSRRYYRGQILKVLLKKQKISLQEIAPLIKKDYVENEFDWLKQILLELESEGFIEINNKSVFLKQ